MKKCDYCGRENLADSRRCDRCGTEFPVPNPPPLPPTPMARAQRTVWWFKIYAAVLCVCYILLGAFAVFLIATAPGDEWLLGLLLLVVAVPLLGACLVSLLVQPKPWLWSYDLVIICLGMTSALFLPASVVLLIHWIKPETKMYFGANPGTVPLS